MPARNGAYQDCSGAGEVVLLADSLGTLFQDALASAPSRALDWRVSQRQQVVLQVMLELAVLR